MPCAMIFSAWIDIPAIIKSITDVTSISQSKALHTLLPTISFAININSAPKKNSKTPNTIIPAYLFRFRLLSSRKAFMIASSNSNEFEQISVQIIKSKLSKCHQLSVSSCQFSVSFPDFTP